MKFKKLTRRAFAAKTSAALVGAVVATNLGRLSARAADAAGPFQAMGTRVGEVTDTTAIVWTRLTQHATRNREGLVMPGRVNEKGKKAPTEITVPVEQLEGACPGAQGRVQVRYGLREDLSDAATTEIATVSEENDFIHQFKLTGLQPGATYHYVSEAPGPDGSPFRGRFRTAPAAGARAEIRFCVMTCQGYPDRGHPEGHSIYPAMAALQPAFTCLTGDLVYYDNDEPRAVTARLARYHWERMFSLPRLVEFTRHHSTYWLKDDHDTLNNDSWPGAKMGAFTFAEGQKIFRQQAPMHDGPSYRTFRWGRHLQIWFTDGRDFRSPNKMPDGPEKTIWGAEQKAWFKRTVKESDATWKVLVSPTPLVGPDCGNKADNHSNAGFRHEGQELRDWLKANAPDNFFVICGDRHWQYHSIDPETGVMEFSAGAASDEHASGSPGEDPRFHSFHRVKGGFLSVAVTTQEDGKGSITFEHRDVHGEVLYSWGQTGWRRLTRKLKV